ncbi:MAG: arylesterase [Xanthomonadales bacterium]|nr:arylesterase [Xanthomonadales bacterium]
MFRSPFKTDFLCCVLLMLCGLLYAGAAAAKPPAILIVGDSISAGYGMTLDESWPRLLQDRLDREGLSYRVVNASITGETTQGGLARLPGLLERHRPEIVVLELGGNDGLRGLDIRATRENLAMMIRDSQAAGATVLLTGIQLPPNYGERYTRLFRDLYAELAEQNGTLLVPFLLEGVALEAGMMQADGIHPSVAAQPVLLDHVWTALSAVLAP